jgi:Helix-turn-helix of insertion element transposase
MAAAKAVGQWQVPNYRPIAVPTSLVVPSGKQHRAALLVADNTKSDLEIATTCGINRRTLARWKEQPSFGARVAELRTTVFR